VKDRTDWANKIFPVLLQRAGWSRYWPQSKNHFPKNGAI